MLQGRVSHGIGLASTAILIQLLQRLIDRKLLPREQVLALLGDAAEELERDAQQSTDMHLIAADIIRKSWCPRSKASGFGCWRPFQCTTRGIL